MTNERNDDEILGRALARAIETQDARETPYERSRIAERPARRGFPLWQVSAVAAMLVLALAFGSWFTRPSDLAPVAASPTPTGGSVAASPSPSPSPTPSSRQTVFVWRDQLPPAVTTAPGGDPTAPLEERIKSRVEALNNAVSGLQGTILRTDPKQFFVRSVKVDGGIVTIDYSAPFPASGTTGDVALMQQIVYTATEDPIVRQVLVTENGRPMSTGHILWDKPLAREDVSGYSEEASQAGSGQSFIADPGTADVPADQLRLSSSFSVDTIALAPGLARFVIYYERTGGALPPGFLPRFEALRPRLDAVLRGFPATDRPGKATLWITVDGIDAKVGVETVDRSPLRSIETIRSGASTTYRIKMDAAYPWRVFTLQNPTRLVVDIGGATQAVSDRIAVYAPKAAQTIDTRISRIFTLSGASRTFEANVVWRLKDSTGRIVASGHTTASLGTSPVWGTFSTEITLPPSVTGNVTLEVFEASPKDGSDQGLVAIPLSVR